MLTRGGPLALSVNQGGGFFRTGADLARPNMQLYFCPLTYEKVPPGTRALLKPDPFSGLTLSASPCRPTSRGELKIKSADPREAPLIQPNYLSTNHDLEELLAGARFLRRLAAAPSLAAVIEQELKPGPATASEEELVADIRARSYSVFHPVGTCRMGADPARAVVDHRLKVHGLGGPPGHRCLDLPHGHLRQYQRAVHHGRRKGRRSRPAGYALATYQPQKGLAAGGAIG